MVGSNQGERLGNPEPSVSSATWIRALTPLVKFERRPAVALYYLNIKYLCLETDLHVTAVKY